MKKSLLPLIKWPLLEILSSLAFLLFLSSCQDHVDIQMKTEREGEIIVEPGKQLDNQEIIRLSGDHILISEPQK
jgi:hypothetical protein